MSSLISLLCSCSVSDVRLKTQPIDNFLDVAVAKANVFQTKITLKIVPQNKKFVYKSIIDFDLISKNFSAGYPLTP